MSKPLFSASVFSALICSAAVLFSAPSQAQDAVTDGEKIAYTCTGCHGIDGYKNVYPHYHVPKIGGQHPEYLSAALTAYANGERDHPTMQAQALGFSEKDIASIVAYLATTANADAHGDVDGNVDSKSAERGQALAVRTDLNDLGQSCASCHGAEGQGTEDKNNPVLAGQYQDYLVQALNDYRSKKRKHDIMNGNVAKLTDEQIEDLAAYFAGLPSKTNDLSHTVD